MSNLGVEPMYMPAIQRLLADVVSFGVRAQGYHWNVVGSDFSQYHKLFGKIYEDAQSSIDPLAENVRKLGGFPPTSLKQFADSCSVAGSELISGSPRHLAADLLLVNEMLVEELKSVFTLFEAANEQGVCDFIAGRIDAHQKWSWQLSSSLTPEDIIIVEGDTSGSSFDAVFAALEAEGLVASSSPYNDFCNSFAYY
jgi:starvation-inducible DNA-binding protein